MRMIQLYPNPGEENIIKDFGIAIKGLHLGIEVPKPYGWWWSNVKSLSRKDAKTKNSADNDITSSQKKILVSLYKNNADKPDRIISLLISPKMIWETVIEDEVTKIVFMIPPELSSYCIINIGVPE